MKNGIVLYPDGDIKLIECEDDEFMNTVRKELASNNSSIDIDVICKDKNYRLIVNDDDCEDVNLVKNNNAHRFADSYSVWGIAVLVKVKNNFDSGDVQDILYMSSNEILKLLNT